MPRRAAGRVPELALTTFFPRYWYDQLSEVDAWFEREMPNAATRPLFHLAAGLKVGFISAMPSSPRRAVRAQRYNTSILVGPHGQIIGKYRKVHLPGHADHRPGIPFQHLRSATSRSAISGSRSGGRSGRWSA